MDKKSMQKSRAKTSSKNSEKKVKGPGHVLKRPRKTTEYGKQLRAKQEVRKLYGVKEKQFRRFFDMAVRSEDVTGNMLISLLERRLDNTLYRMKLASTRRQARQMVVHELIRVNGAKVHSPSYLVAANDEVTLAPRAQEKEGFVQQVIDRRLMSSAKVPDWIELDKKNRTGRVVRNPVRDDVVLGVDENAIVELYSK